MDNLEKTLRKIEKLEKEWKYTLSEVEDKQHSFGRVPEDDREVAFWSVPRSTGEFLRFMVRFAKSKTILELGCSAGYSTLFLVDGAKENKGKVYTTEILKAKIKLAKKHFKESGLSEYITLIEKDIMEVLKEWEKKNKLDLVFMDADKEKYIVYLDLLIPLLSEKGIIIVDNAGKVRMVDGRLIDSEHINKFVKKVKSRKDLNSFFLNIDNGLLLISRR